MLQSCLTDDLNLSDVSTLHFHNLKVSSCSDHYCRSTSLSGTLVLNWSIIYTKRLRLTVSELMRSRAIAREPGWTIRNDWTLRGAIMLWQVLRIHWVNSVNLLQLLRELSRLETIIESPRRIPKQFNNNLIIDLLYSLHGLPFLFFSDKRNCIGTTEI